jgi:hypothetical protein
MAGRQVAEKVRQQVVTVGCHIPNSVRNNGRNPLQTDKRKEEQIHCNLDEREEEPENGEIKVAPAI